VAIANAVTPGHFVRQVGEDVQPGDIVVEAGEVLSPARLGLLAAVGCQRVRVIPIPRVGVLSTGDELVTAGADLRHGQIHDSNLVLLRGLVTAAGCQPIDLGAVGDDPASITAALRDAANRCDAVLTTGGVSVGDFDYLAGALAEVGESRTFQLPIKPAKPFVFGRIGDTPVFGLPGNPVSAAVSFELLARPALRQMAGYAADQLDRPAVIALADEALDRRPDGKTHYIRVATRWDGDGRVHVHSAGGQGSHVLSGLAAAGGLAVVPDGSGVRAGDEVRVLLFDVPSFGPPMAASNGDATRLIEAEIERSGADIDPEDEGFAVDAGGSLAERNTRAFAPVLVAAVVLAVVALPLSLFNKSFPIKTTDSSFIPGWVKWNYEGYERKTAYPEYKDVIATMARVGKENGCGRSSWEYESELDRLGTPMALMLLPYWTKGCIGSMEGLYFESSATTPYHFLSNSELSLRPPRPQRDLPYRDLDVRLGVQHLQLMGVRYYMALSDAAKDQARANPDLTLVDHSNAHVATVTESGKPAEAKTRDWEVYEVANSDIVAPLRFEPVVMRGVPKGGKEYQKAAVEWFNGDASRWDVPLAVSGPGSWARVNGVPANPPRKAVKPATVTNIKSKDDRISFDVDRIGSPVLIKASYFPNWKASGARGPWRVTPNAMVVIPTSKHVTIHYGYTPVDRTGWALTLLGILGVVVLTRRRTKNDDDDSDGVVSEAPAVSASAPAFTPELEPQSPQPVH
jgi:molybdenum cofactor synthesis domain-containing protein